MENDTKEITACGKHQGSASDWRGIHATLEKRGRVTGEQRIKGAGEMFILMT